MKMNIWMNSHNKKELKQKKMELEFQDDTDSIENEVVNIYPEITFQTIEGFGGAITDAAAYVYSLMSKEQKAKMLQTYFSEKQMQYGLIRIHMDSCDFSTEMYEAMSDENDRELKSFSFSRTEKYIIPMLEDAKRAAGKKLEIMLSPWSPPAFMKTNGERRFGGELKPGYEGFWADYICRYIMEFRKRGFLVRRISLQNEAKAVQTWDSCIYTPEQEKVFLRDHMYPALMRHGLEDVEVFVWDHNKERVFDRVNHIVDDSTKHMVAGVACHWYSGDHFEALDMTRKLHPDLKLIMSESCIEFRTFKAEEEWEYAVKLSHELIGDLNHGICAFYDWNILLDETGGPNHAGNLCHAPFLYNKETKQLIPQITQKTFYHFSHFIRPGAVRIGCSRYTEKIEAVAFQNPDGKIVVILFNPTGKEIPVVLRCKDKVVKWILPAETIATGYEV